MLRGIPPSVNVNFPPSFARVPSHSPLTPHYTWEMSRGQANSPFAASFPSNAAQSFPGGMALPSISHLTGGAQQKPERWPLQTAQQFAGVQYTAMTSPGATSCGGQGNSIAPPVCQNCSTSTTPLWRRDEIGSVLCNACGLFLKLHGRPRPISLKTDVIKSRNRIKNTTPQNKKRLMMQQMGPGMPASDMNLPSNSNNHPSGQEALAYGDRMSPGSISRTHTPGGMNGHHQQQPYYDPNLGRSPSPTMQQFPGHYQGLHSNHLAHANNGHGAGSLPATHASSAPPSYNELQTRVSELEVINELYRSRVAELEAQVSRDKDTIHKMKVQLGGSASVHGDDSSNIINEEMIANGNGSPHSQGQKRKSDALEDPAAQDWSKRMDESYPEPPQPQMIGA